MKSFVPGFWAGASVVLGICICMKNHQKISDSLKQFKDMGCCMTEKFKGNQENSSSSEG